MVLFGSVPGHLWIVIFVHVQLNFTVTSPKRPIWFFFYKSPTTEIHYGISSNIAAQSECISIDNWDGATTIIWHTIEINTCISDCCQNIVWNTHCFSVWKHFHLSLKSLVVIIIIFYCKLWNQREIKCLKPRNGPPARTEQHQQKSQNSKRNLLQRRIPSTKIKRMEIRSRKQVF